MVTSVDKAKPLTSGELKRIRIQAESRHPEHTIARLLATVAVLETRVIEERDAKRGAINVLMDLVEIGRRLADTQPAVHARDQGEADAWAKFCKLLNEAPVSFQADLDAAVKRAQESEPE